MSLARYASIVIVLFLTTLGSLWLLAPGSLGAEARRAASLGGALAALNALAAYGLIRWSQGRSPAFMLKAVMGGMLVRLCAVVLALLAAIGLYDVPTVPLLVSLLAYFVVFLALELAALSRRAPEGAVR